MALFPTRVVGLPDGTSAFTFTMFQPEGLPDEVFEQQYESLRRELGNVERPGCGSRAAAAMSQRSGPHVVVGASGGIGSSVVRELRAGGRAVRAVARSLPDVPPGVEALCLRRRRPRRGAGGLRGRIRRLPLRPTALPALDAGVSTADRFHRHRRRRGGSPPRGRRQPLHVRARGGPARRGRTAATPVAARTAEAGPGRAAPRGPPLGRSRGRDRQGLRLLRPARPKLGGGRPRLPAGRPGTARALARPPRSAAHAALPGGRRPRASSTLGEHDRAFGEAWHLPAAPPVTGREFLELVFEEAGPSTSARPRCSVDDPGRRPVVSPRARPRPDDVSVDAAVRLRRVEVRRRVRAGAGHASS